MAVLDEQPLKIERRIRSLAGGNQIRARHINGFTGIFFVACHDDFDVGILERACGVHSPQRRHDDNHSTLIVTGTWSFGLLAAPFKFLEWRVFLKHGIEMRNQQ